MRVREDASPDPFFALGRFASTRAGPAVRLAARGRKLYSAPFADEPVKEKSMRSFVRVSLAACVPFTAALVACGQPPAAQAPASVAPAAAAPSQVERGRTLVTVGGCH